jgi:hypothetical protein
MKQLILLILALTAMRCTDNSTIPLKVGVFSFNATPEIGVPVAYAMTRSIQDSLYGKGIVILSDQQPIVIGVVDWLGIANEGLERWKVAMAEAAGTSVERVSLHAVHQHDGARSDFTTAKLLEDHGLGGWRYDTTFLIETIKRGARAVKYAMQHAQPVTHLGYGKAKVEKVASNRRIMGEGGKVAIIRWSRSTDSAAIAAPEGLIDPWLRSVSFWNQQQPVVNLNYYTTHPMSHYGQGDVSSDFVGIARERREQALGFIQVYFSGAGGNITAGKYNDGSPERRYVLADRVEIAMEQAWQSTVKVPVSADDLVWNSTKVVMPLGPHLVERNLMNVLEDENADSLERFTAAKHLAWLYRTNQGYQTTVSALNLKNVWLLNLPGELFVEYQLAAQELRPDDFVCTAAYEEYGPGYICTEVGYGQGGYEDSERASRVGPAVESMLMGAIEQVLIK